MESERNWKHPWLNPRRLLRSDRLPQGFEELYDAALRDIDETRAKRRNSVVASFETLWAPVLEQLSVSGDERASALNDVIDTHILYRCLRSSLDRAPQLDAVRRDIESVQTKLREAFNKLRALSSFKELAVAEEEFHRQHGGTSRRTRQRIDDALLSRLFEIRSRDALGQSLGQINVLLDSVWAKKVQRHRGQPRKYSKDFLILRSARIFERYRPDDRAAIRPYREHPDIGPRDYDRGRFYRFVLTGFSIVETSFQPAAFGLEKSIMEMLRIRKRNPDVDLLITKRSTPDDLVAFARFSESKRKNSSSS